MKRKIIVTGGLVIFLSVMSANIQFAISGYGIGTNSLHAEVLAQSTTSGGTGSGSGGGLLWKKKMTNTDCTYEKVTTYWVCAGGVISYVFVHGCIETTDKLTFKGKMSRCDNGWSFCWSGCEGSGTGT